MAGDHGRSLLTVDAAGLEIGFHIFFGRAVGLAA
jgi:hypothetical protein